MLRPAVLLLAAALVLQIVFVGATLAVARAVGARVSALAVGAPILLRREVRGMEVRLGLLPLTAYVQFPGMLPWDTDGSPGSWRTLGLGARLLVIAGPWAATLVIAMACLGGARAALSLVHAVPQLLFVLDLTPLVRGFLHLLATEPFLLGLGVVMAKATSLNLLPFDMLAGGKILRETSRALRGPRDTGEEKPNALALVVSALFLFVWVMGRIVWGLAHALR